MSIEHYVLPAHDVAGFEKWFDCNPQLWFVLEEELDFRSKGAAMYWPSFNPYTFNKPRIVCPMASMWLTKVLRAISVVRRS